MDKKGVGYEHEILFAVFFLVLVLAFYGGGAIVPPLLLLVGAICMVAGLSIRQPALTAGGIVILAVALIYNQVVL